jgi:hypothetical protein
MRDPFPMKFSQNANGEPVALWVVDLHRLNDKQIAAIEGLIADLHAVSIKAILQDSDTNGGFCVSHASVSSISGGAENYRRTLELLDRSVDFEQIDLEELDNELNDFYAQQYRDWIVGDRVPEPMPENYEDIDPRMKNPELEKAYRQIAIQKFLASAS